MSTIAGNDESGVAGGGGTCLSFTPSIGNGGNPPKGGFIIGLPIGVPGRSELERDPLVLATGAGIGIDVGPSRSVVFVSFS
jgi:hypothetical protein